MKAADAIPTAQRRRSSCGAACVKNAVRLLGTRVTEAKSRRLCGTTDDGTDELEITEGLRRLGYAATPFTARTSQAAVAAVLRHLPDRPVIICVDDDDHWMLVCQIAGRKFVVHDPAKGLAIVGEDDLCRRWVNHAGEYYGIAVSPATDETRKRETRQTRPDLESIARRGR